jgi:lysophospholipid acyltransferase (LPLAT)-like uncharacterized protein
LWLLGLILRAWGRTLRVQLDPSTSVLLEQREPAVVMFWHNRLFFAARMLRLFGRERPVVGLVSASRDGAALSRFMSFLGVRTIRGSTSRFGREAVHALINELRAGNDVVVTPDGPRGPMYDMKPGSLLAARRARAPILMIGISCRACWAVRSWDRFRIPLPFARVVVRGDRIEIASLEDGPEPLARLRRRLLTVNGDGDQV